MNKEGKTQFRKHVQLEGPEEEQDLYNSLNLKAMDKATTLANR
jgi:hypothetical protein